MDSQTPNQSERRWFLLNNSRIQGPFATEEIEQKVQQAPQALIWGRGQSDWVPFERWSKLLLEFAEIERRNRLQQERFWTIKINGQELNPMKHEEMMNFLKLQTDFSQILIWTEGYEDWKEIYQIHKIMDELGVSRRNHPRVPIMGTLTCEATAGNFTARVLSISEGGLGITETPPLKIGEKLKTILKSPNLFAPIHATAEIVYVGNDGYAGLKFIGLHSESKSTIIEYVNKFQNQKIINEA